MSGLSFLHLELTSRCNKKCWMCGRRKMEKEYPELCDWGDMSIHTLYHVFEEVPKKITVQFHNNGEPLLYLYLGQALKLFKGNIRCLNTNGKLLLERADEIIGNLETLTISVIENDPEGEEQYEVVSKFVGLKGDRNPSMVYRLLGKVDGTRWSGLPGVLAKRVLHSPDGSFDYEKKATVPEIGVCLDLLTHLAIDRHGNVSLCVRFDPEGHLRLGNIMEKPLFAMWHGGKRKAYIQKHLEGKRNELPGCARCEYWGVPTGQ